MKRFLGILLTGMLLLGTCCGCEPATPKSVVLQGYPYTVSEGNQITITDAFMEGNSIVVKLSVDFTSAALKDLKGITVRKMEVEQPDIPCDAEETAKRNGGEDIFALETYGERREIVLVFTDSSINDKIELSNYVLSVPVGYDNDGNLVLNDAMALG